MDFNVKPAKKKPAQKAVTPAKRPEIQTTYVDTLTLFSDIVKELEREASGLVVKDDDTNAYAVQLTGEVKKVFKKIEARRVEIVKPHNEFVRDVNKFAKLFTEPLKKLEKDLKKKQEQYFYQQEMARRKREAEMRRRQEEIQQKMQQEAEKVGVDAPVIPPPAMPTKRGPVRTATGTQSVSMEWTFEIEDFGEIPRQYLMVDEKAIRAAINAGIRTIPGVKIFEKPKISIRT